MTSRPDPRRKVWICLWIHPVGGQLPARCTGISVDPWSCSETVSIAEVGRQCPTRCIPRRKLLDAVRRARSGANREGFFRMPEAVFAGGKTARTVAGSPGQRESAPRGAPVDGRRSGSRKPGPLTRVWRRRSWLSGEAREGGAGWRQGASEVGQRAQCGAEKAAAWEAPYGTELLVPMGRVRPPRRASRARPKLEERRQPRHSTRAKGAARCFSEGIRRFPGCSSRRSVAEVGERHLVASSSLAREGEGGGCG
jgi:hypothetical protein